MKKERRRKEGKPSLSGLARVAAAILSVTGAIYGVYAQPTAFTPMSIAL
jgi:hypothetical protein